LVLSGLDANERRLKSLAEPPRALHLATHGFFLAEQSDAPADDWQRPMLLSGIALAGANRGLEGKLGPDGENGILYALEALDLNPEGTELVTLSACDTGQGALVNADLIAAGLAPFQPEKAAAEQAPALDADHAPGAGYQCPSGHRLQTPRRRRIRGPDRRLRTAVSGLSGVAHGRHLGLSHRATRLGHDRPGVYPRPPELGGDFPDHAGRCGQRAGLAHEGL